MARCGYKRKSNNTWRLEGEEADFFYIKGITETLLNTLNIRRRQLSPIRACSWLHPKKSASFFVGEKEVCRFGEFHPVLSEKFELKKNIALLEINIDEINLAVGPEGGWVPYEIDMMESLGFKKFSLSRWTLRVETALTACLSQIELQSMLLK